MDISNNSYCVYVIYNKSDSVLAVWGCVALHLGLSPTKNTFKSFPGSA